jgi:hypothetical protein
MEARQLGPPTQLKNSVALCINTKPEDGQTIRKRLLKLDPILLLNPKR